MFSNQRVTRKEPLGGHSFNRTVNMARELQDTIEPQDHAFLEEAIRLSREKSEAGEGGPFGAVIVRGDRVVGRGWNRVTSTNDPTAHAEIVAIRDACTHLQSFSLTGCEI